MTPLEVITYARQQYNAVSDSFFSDSELYKHVWAAQMELAREAFLIERVYTTTTTADQQEYSYPTNTIAIKRITYNGQKLMPITFREDDALTLSNQTTTATGTPLYYAIWNETLYLRPIPAESGTLKIWSINEPQEVTSTSTLEVPTAYHHDLTNFVLWRMASKDQNFQAAQYWRDEWQKRVEKAKRDARKAKRGDSFTAIQDLETLPVTVIGAV